MLYIIHSLPLAVIQIPLMGILLAAHTRLSLKSIGYTKILSCDISIQLEFIICLVFFYLLYQILIERIYHVSVVPRGLFDAVETFTGRDRFVVRKP